MTPPDSQWKYVPSVALGENTGMPSMGVMQRTPRLTAASSLSAMTVG